MYRVGLRNARDPSILAAPVLFALYFANEALTLLFHPTFDVPPWYWRILDLLGFLYVTVRWVVIPLAGAAASVWLLCVAFRKRDALTPHRLFLATLLFGLAVLQWAYPWPLFFPPKAT